MTSGTVIKVPSVKGEIPDDAHQVSVTRAQFEKWTEHILARIELPIRRGLGDANLKRGDVQEVILVGGATRMRAVIDRTYDLDGIVAAHRYVDTSRKRGNVVLRLG